MVVRKYAHSSSGEPGAIDNTGVNEFIQDDNLAGTDQTAEGANRRGISAAKEQRALGSLECRKRLFQLPVRGLRTRNQSRCSSTHTEMFDRFLSRRFKGGVL